ncbi:unnamed protein product [Effrenium voratum]|nr:unnamed protein product [Effrenium voratum]
MWLRRDGGVGMEPAVGLPLGVNEYAPLGISTVSSSTSPLARAAAGARRLHFQSSEICCQVRGARRQCSGRVTEATALEESFACTSTFLWVAWCWRISEGGDWLAFPA